VNTPTWIAAALLAPLAAAQTAEPQAAASAPPAFELLSAQASLPSGPFARAPGVVQASIASSMRALADAGDGRALAWCLRNPGAHLPAEDRARYTAAGLVELVRAHSGADWLRAPELDPASVLERADRATRGAVAAALAVEPVPDDGARQLALLLEAAALAPTHLREQSLAAQALARLDELRGTWPQGTWSARAADLAWRIEHLAPGRTAPALALRDVDGNELWLEDWRGGDVLVDVWRSDDPERGEHAAELAALVGRVSALRPDLGLRVLGLGLGADERAFRLELEELDLPWPTAFETQGEGPAHAAWRLDGRPMTLWIDAAGVVRARGGSLAELEALLLAPGEAPGVQRHEPSGPVPSDGIPAAAAPGERRESP
jgi:hypothetical protein